MIDISNLKIKKTSNGLWLFSLIALLYLISKVYFFYMDLNLYGVFDFWSKIMRVLYCLSILVFCAAFFLLEVRKAKLETIFVILALLFGSIFSLLLPPGYVPDELSHTRKSYEMAWKMLGWTETSANSGYLIRKVDKDYMKEIQLCLDDYNRDSMNRNYGRPFFLDDTQQNTLVDGDENYVAPDLYYVPSGLGVALAYILHLAPIPTMYLARFANLFVFLLMGYVAMRLLPFGKEAFLIVSLFPMTMQLVMSTSYDCIMISLHFLTLALTLKMAFGENKPKIWKWPILFLLIVLIFIGKSHAYFAAAFLPLIVLLHQYPLPDAVMKRVRIAIALAAVVFLAGLVIGMVFFEVPYTPGTYFLDRNGLEGYTLRYIWNHPKDVAYLFYRSLSRLGDMYLLSMAAAMLGRLTINTPSWVSIFMLSFAFLAFLRSPKEEKKFTPDDTVILWGIAFVGIACSFAGMLLSWTALIADTVEGVQGRYFLPVLPMILLTVRQIGIQIDEELRRHLVLAMCFVEALAVYYIILDGFI